MNGKSAAKAADFFNAPKTFEQARVFGALKKWSNQGFGGLSILKTEPCGERRSQSCRDHLFSWRKIKFALFL
jgi:hypothetical protein